MRNIVFATGNEGKLREIRDIMAESVIVSMKEAGIDAQIEENGTTFEENALIKARGVRAYIEAQNQKQPHSGTPYADAIVLADDSGLEIDYLNREPGIYSARYMGEDTSYEVKNKELLRRLEGVPKEKRTARFVCAVAAVFPDGETLVRRGVIEGYIGEKPAGENGFGYDPIFYLEEYRCSTAELSREKKNALSHRGRALRAVREELEKRIQGV